MPLLFFQMSRVEEEEYFSAMKIDKQPMPESTPHDSVVQLAISRYGESVSPHDVYSVNPGDRIFTWLSSMFTPGQFGLTKLPFDTTLIAASRDNDPDKSERIGARIRVVDRFGEYPLFFKQGEKTRLLLISDPSVASTYNVWKHSTEDTTLDDVGNFEENDEMRFAIEPYSGNPVTEVAADSVMYIDFTGSDANKGVVPVAKDLVQHFLRAQNPKFPVTSDPVPQNSALHRRFSAWVVTALDGNAPPFKYVAPVVVYTGYNPVDAPDLQQNALAYLINVRNYTEDELLLDGVSQETVLLHLVNVYAREPLNGVMRMPKRLLMKGARLSLRSVDRHNYRAYSTLAVSTGMGIETHRVIPWPTNIDTSDVDFAAMRAAFSAGNLVLMQNTFMASIYEDVAPSAFELIKNGVPIENHLRFFLRLEVEGFPVVIPIIRELIHLGVRVSLDEARDFELEPAYAAHCEAIEDGSEIPDGVLPGKNGYIPAILESRSLLRVEQLLCSMRAVDDEHTLKFVEEYKLSPSMALALALRYNNGAVARTLFQQGHRPDKRIMALLDPASPGAAIYAELLEEYERGRPVLSEFDFAGYGKEEAVRLLRSLQASAADKMTAPIYYVRDDRLAALFNHVTAGSALDVQILSAAPSVNFHFGPRNDTLLTSIADSKPTNFHYNSRVLLRHGANPWGMNDLGISFSDIICGNPELFQSVIECILHMRNVTERINRELAVSHDATLLETEFYDFQGHYVQPPLIFNAITHNSERVVFGILRRLGGYVRWNGMTPLQYAKKIRSPIAPVLERMLVDDGRTLADAIVSGQPSTVANKIWGNATLDHDLFFDRMYDERGNYAYAFALLADAGYFRLGREIPRYSMAAAVLTQTDAALFMVLAENGCSPFYARSDATPAYIAHRFGRAPMIEYFQKLARKEIDCMPRRATRILDFMHNSFSSGNREDIYRSLPNITLDELERRLEYWNIPTTELDVIVKDEGADVKLSELRSTTRARVLVLGGAVFTRDTFNLVDWKFWGCKVVLQSHFVTPAQIAVYDLGFVLSKRSLRQVCNRWVHVYPVPYPVLGWIAAALQFDPSLARAKDVVTRNKIFPQLLFFFARNPAVTVRLIWNMTLPVFAKAVEKARVLGKLHPGLFSAMAELGHPLAKLRERAVAVHSSDFAFMTTLESDVLHSIRRGDGPFQLEARPHVREVVDHIDAQLRNEDVDNIELEIGQCVRWLTLMPSTEAVRDDAEALFRAVAKGSVQFYRSQALSMVVAGLVRVSSPAVAEWWKTTPGGSGNFLSLENVITYHARMIDGVRVLGGAATCAIYDFFSLGDGHAREGGLVEYLNSRDCDKSFRKTLLKYDASTSVYGGYFFVKKAKSTIIAISHELHLDEERSLSTFEDRIGFKYVLPASQENVFWHEAMVERQIEDMDRDVDGVVFRPGAWATRFLIMDERAAYGSGRHLKLSAAQKRDLSASVIFMRMASRMTTVVGAWAKAMEILSDRNVVFDSHACDGLSIFSALFPRGHTAQQVDDHGLTLLLSIAALRDASLLDPVIDGRPLAFLGVAPSDLLPLTRATIDQLIPLAVAALAPGVNREHPIYLAAREQMRRRNFEILPSQHEIDDQPIPAQHVEIDV